MINRVPRSQKLRFYESLFLWNQSVDQVIATLRDMEKFPFARKEALHHAQAEIEGLRADVNGNFLEDMSDRELDDGGRFSKQRRAYEIKREDPDDVYIDVLRREEQRKRQRLPPRIGIIPHSAVADEETRVEEEHERVQPSSKHSKPLQRPRAATGRRVGSSNPPPTTTKVCPFSNFREPATEFSIQHKRDKGEDGFRIARPQSAQPPNGRLPESNRLFNHYVNLSRPGRIEIF
jgi:hypothetical protein